jgi:hypothetical protein
MTALLKPCSLAVLAAALVLTGCSGSSTPATSTSDQTAAAAPATPQPVTARTALGPMYKSALSWSSDIQLLGLASQTLPGFQNDAGKAAIWQATFGSASLHQSRVYSNAMPIDMSMFTVDSDAAYQTSSAHAADWLKKNPDKPLSELDLGSTFTFRTPTWYVQWGDKKSGYVVLVDASTGAIFKSK